MTLNVCGGCAHVVFGDAPDNCPVCGAPKNSFMSNDNLFDEAMEKSKEGAIKHIPAVQVNKVCGLVPENDCIDVIVRIGETLHPMEQKHFIVWNDCYVEDKYVSRIYYTPGVNPAVIFHVKPGAAGIRIVSYCNLHGHWQKEASV